MNEKEEAPRKEIWRVQAEVAAFMQAAQKFCSVIENPAADLRIWIKDVLLSTAVLYTVGLALSQIPTPEITDVETERQPIEQWQELYNHLSTLLREKRWYACVSFETHPAHQVQKQLYGDLADDLADIYRDVITGLRRWNTTADEYLGDIVWDWQFHFIHHWGDDHAAAALRYLHYLVFSS
ncbi:MAG TPA: DUF5063 domain-containing protein [Ktedonobacteraceae bacterium]|nr:DUF5063 domain-containing protein [Ktedonobacteraceae bacterium]